MIRSFVITTVNWLRWINLQSDHGLVRGILNLFSNEYLELNSPKIVVTNMNKQLRNSHGSEDLMALTLKVALDCVPTFDGNGYLTWAQDTVSAIENIKESERPGETLGSLPKTKVGWQSGCVYAHTISR